MIDKIKMIQTDLHENQDMTLHQCALKQFQQVYSAQSLYENGSESSFVNSSFFASPVKSMTANKKVEEFKLAKQPSKPKIASQLSRIIESPTENPEK